MDSFSDTSKVIRINSVKDIFTSFIIYVTYIHTFVVSHGVFIHINNPQLIFVSSCIFTYNTVLDNDYPMSSPNMRNLKVKMYNDYFIKRHGTTYVHMVQRDHSREKSTLNITL